MIALIVYLGGPISLITLALVTGSIIEHNHLNSLREREARLRIGVSNLEPGALGQGVEVRTVVCGQAVIAADRFKILLGNIVSIFGGELKALTSVMARARREAVLRMLEEAEELGADQVWNVRFETSNIGRGENGRAKGAVMAEMLAYGTAVRIRKAA